MPRILLASIALLLILPTTASADPAPAGAIVVNTTSDDGGRCDQGASTCSLRAAITTANAKPGPDTIAFNLPLVTRIAPLQPLPAITERVTIDGFTQAGVPQATRPLIELDGSQMAVGARGPAGKGATAQPVANPKAKATRASDAGVIRFLRPWGLDLRNADGSTIRGLIVHDFPYAQIGLDGTDQATITGNWLGLTPMGDAQTRTSVEDLRLGLSLINSAQATIGGIGRDKNVISGNDYGITLMDAGSGANVILGNYIGATTDGLGHRPNRETGILLTEPVGTTGRGTRQNVLAGNVVLGDRKTYGISLLAATETSVIGNFVGLNAAGQAKSPTGEELGHDIGIYVHDSPRTEVGGNGTAEFNLIAGSVIGVEINGGSNRSKLVGNRIGTDYEGTSVIDGSGNRSGAGIVADGESEAPADMVISDNTIAGSSDYGMYITGGPQRATVTNNRFGTDGPNRIGFAAGYAPSGAGAPGDLTFGPGNVVAGNSQDGVQMLGGANAVVRGNRIGVSADGQPLGNGSSGVLVTGDGTLVESNTVSANAQGVVVTGAADGVRVRNNVIGAAPGGGASATDFGNLGAGVLVGGTAPDYPAGTRIGGSERNDGNVISGNARGVQVHADADDTFIRQNHIGVDSAGTAAIPNGVGITLQGGEDTTVGGALGIDSRNLIAHNEDAGIRLNGALRSTIIGNYITDNDGPGVLADTRRSDAVIGWTVQSGEPMDDVTCRDTRCNRIENNEGAGVRVQVPSPITVRGNRMRDNTGLDVDLAGLNQTANDDADVDDWLNSPTGVAPIKSGGGKPDRVGGELDTYEPHKTLVDVYGFTSAQLIGGRPRGGEHIGTAFPSSSGQWFVDAPKAYAAYASVVTDRHGTTSELSPACVGDADGDALCDNWETDGIDYDADGSADQRLEGASPSKPDLFVEVDWQEGRKPHLKALYNVKEAFELAPRPITLHTAIDEQVPGSSAIDAVGRSNGRHNDVADFLKGSDLDPCDGFFGTEALRDDPACAAKLGARKLAYRYAVFGGRQLQGTTGAADPGGDAFFVTLGDLTRESVMLGGGSGEFGCNRQYDACVAELEAATFMHELGHTLGLLHGGDNAGENNEPNYLSVMNYLFQWRVPLNSRPLDYSRKTLTGRDEKAFDEGLEFEAAYPQRAQQPWTETIVTAYDRDRDQCRRYPVNLTTKPLEIDYDDAANVVAMGLNDVDLNPDPNGLEACQKPANQTGLTGVDDWARLRYSRGALVGWDEDHYAPEQPGAHAGETDPAELAAGIDSDKDGIDDDEDVCPAAADPGQQDADGDGLGDACLSFITTRDVEVSLEAASANLPIGEERDVKVVVRNTYPKPAAGAVVAVTLPAGVELVSGSARWEAGEIPARGAKEHTLRVRGVSAGRGDLVAELVELTDTDWDSTPNNHHPAEDDQAAKRLTVFAAGAVPSLSIRAVVLREGDEGERIANVRVILDAPAGMTVSGRLQTVDVTAKADEDYKPVDMAFEIAPFTSERHIEIPVYGDSTAEPDETFAVELTGVDGATPETARETVTILDDDQPLQPGQLGWLGCASRDYGAGGSCPQREPLLTAPWGNRALTPDGRFLFVPDDERIVRLTRNLATGALSEAKCFTTSGQSDAGCVQLGDLAVDPGDLAISPDGKRLYVLGGATATTDGDSGLLSLAIDATTGDLSYDGCAGHGGPGCTEAIDRADVLLVAPDARHVLIIGGGQGRNHGEITVYPVVDGHLQPAARCYAHPAENKPCEPLTVNLDGIPYADFSPDGRTLAVRTKGHLALLGWDDGQLSLAGCVLAGGTCRPATECRYNGDREFVCDAPPEALASIGPVRFAPDGRALYVASHDANRVTALPRTAAGTWSVDASMCVGRADTDCALHADLVDEALEMVVAPDGGDVYVAGYGNGVTALRADRITGALSAPRCSYGELGVGSCDRAYPQRSGAYSLSRGNLILDPSGRDLYTTVWLPGTKIGVGRFLRVTRPPDGQNRAPVCADVDANVRPGVSVEVQLRCADPDGDPVTLRLTRGAGELAGTLLRLKAPVSAGLQELGFRASDGGLESAEAVVRIVVGDPPACQDARVTVDAYASVTLPLNCDRGAVEIVEHPAYGGVLGTTFKATWRDGTEYVRFAADDPDTDVRSNVATVTVIVRPLPPPPPVVNFGRVSLENDRGGSNSGCSGSSCRAGRNGELPFPMRCNGSPTQTPGTCSGTLEACSATGACRGSTGGRPTIAAVKGSLGRVKFSIGVGKSKTVKLRLNRAARKELAKRGKLKLRVRTTVRLPDGRTVTSTRKLTVKKPAKAKRER